MNGAGLIFQFRVRVARIVAGLIATALLSGVHPIWATDLLVYNKADSGPGSLRQAIADNAALGGGNRIVFSNTVTGAITLTNGELLVANDLTILGPGPGILAINGNYPDSNNRIFRISNSIVSISGLAITNGHAQTTGYLPNIGGGIVSDHATLTVNDCLVGGNSASNVGGGIFNGANTGSATLLASNCTFTGNLASLGGAIYNDGASVSGGVVVDNCTFTGNSANGNGSGDGGAIFNSGYLRNAVLTVIASTFCSNSVSILAGAILNYNGTCVVIGCCFNGNTAGTGGGIGNYGISGGGAMTLTVTNSTFTGNSATNAGAGIWNSGTLAVVIASTK